MGNEKTFKPYISMVVSGRNDLHCGDFVGRLNNTLRVTDYQSKFYKFDLEYIIVEWNPHQNDNLAKVLYKPSSTNFKVRIITVDKKLHLQTLITEFDALEADKMTFFQGIAQNVGFRRSNSEFILSTNGDIILSPELWNSIRDTKLDPKNFYRAFRFDGTINIPQHLHVSEITKFLNETSVIRGENFDIINKLFTKAAGDFILSSKSLLNKIKGFSEIRCDGCKIDGDMLQLMIRFATQNVFVSDLKIYHQFHEDRYKSTYNKINTVRRYKKSKIKLEHISDSSSVRTVTTTITRNNDNWGLKDKQLPEITL